MTVFITDSEERYEASAAERKILLEIAVIKKSSFLSPEAISAIDTLNNSSEIIAGETYIGTLESLLKKLELDRIGPIPFMEHKPAYEQAYSLLFHRLYDYAKCRFQLEAWLQNFRAFYPDEQLQPEFDLGAAYSWFAVANKSLNCAILPGRPSFSEALTGSVKNLLQSPLRRTKPQKKLSGATKVMIVSYNIAHHLDIFRNYVRHTLEQTKHEIHVVLVSNESNAAENVVSRIYGNNARIFTHDFSDFRTTCFHSPAKALGQIISQLPELSFLKNDPYFTGLFRNYSWMQTALKTLRPDIALIVNLHETGRILSDVAAVKSVPTVQVDYGLFSDHHLMNSRISFTARAVLSDAVKEVWERRGDTSRTRIPIGFTKLDDAKPAEAILAEKLDFFTKNGLDPAMPTVFFASTWSQAGEAYDTEKKEIVAALSGICARNGYNLLVKKHPLEHDNLLEKLVANRPNQRIFNHPDIHLEKAIVFSDLITTQGSSVVLESLFYGKMPVFLGTSPSKKLILAGMTNSDSVIYFSDFGKLEVFIDELFHDEKTKVVHAEMVAQKMQHILYKTDGKAYIRLYELAEKLMKKATSYE